MGRAAASELREGYERVVAEHGAAVRRVCGAILRDDALGADAAQEALLRLWRRWCAGDPPDHPGGWLRRVAVSAALDQARRTRAHDAARAGAAAETGERTADGPERELAASELERAFRDALERLPEGQRTVFVLRHDGGLRLREVADLLHVALPTVKTQFARACLKLQAALAPFDPRTDTREP